MKTNKILTLLIALVVGLLAGLLLAPGGHDALSQPKGGLTLSEKVQEVSQLIDGEYVDFFDADSVSNQMINAMLLTLDPHSRYLSAEEIRRESESIQGNFSGIGVMLRYRGDTVYVSQVMSEGPSANSGLHPGDCIVTVDGDTVSGVGLDAQDVVSRIRGPHNTKVRIGINRYGENGLRHFDIVRGTVFTYSITYAGMLDSKTGYIRLTSFTETTGDEFLEALEKLKKSGMSRLVLDLRGNGGGLLQAAVMVADELLPKNDLIVYTEGARQRRSNIKATRGGAFETGSLVVMIDEYSASASEIVAGAVQDNDRGTIVGRRSFGKGLVQRQFDLSDNSAVWLTVARYYTPSGRCIQRPYDTGFDDYYESFLERLMEAPTLDSNAVEEVDDVPDNDVRQSDTTPYHTKKGRVVYGGGGIAPDHIFPYISDSATLRFNRLVNSGKPLIAANDYVRANYPDLARDYRDIDTFVKKFKVPAALFQQCCDSSLLPRQHHHLEELIKAYIAQELFGEEGFFRIYTPFDNDIIRALKL